MKYENDPFISYFLRAVAYIGGAATMLLLCVALSGVNNAWKQFFIAAASVASFSVVCWWLATVVDLLVRIAVATELNNKAHATISNIPQKPLKKGDTSPSVPTYEIK